MFFLILTFQLLTQLIETKLKDRKDCGTSTTFRLKQEITRLTQRNQELEKKVFAGGAGGSLAIERVKELEQQLKAARSRALAVSDSSKGDGSAPNGQPPPPPGQPASTFPDPPKPDGASKDGGGDETGSAAVWKAKAKALEEQLVENARGFATQLAQVKLKLMEAEMGGGSSDDDSDSD